jgi:hypothetical protein
VLDDRVSYRRMIDVYNYFDMYAEVFYHVAQRKFDVGEVEDNLISIGNADVVGETLPDIRTKIYTDQRQSAVLAYGDTKVRCLTLQEAVIAWHQLAPEQKRFATISARDGGFYSGAEIDTLHAARAIE